MYGFINIMKIGYFRIMKFVYKNGLLYCNLEMSLFFWGCIFVLYGKKLLIIIIYIGKNIVLFFVKDLEGFFVLKFYGCSIKKYFYSFGEISYNFIVLVFCNFFSLLFVF